MSAQKIIIVKMGKVGKSWSIEVTSRSENLLSAIQGAIELEKNMNGYRIFNAASPFEIKKKKQKALPEKEKPQTALEPGVAVKVLPTPMKITFYPQT